MDTQILNTIITALATLIAALCGSLVTYFINSKKNRVELKLKKLDYLIVKREILEKAKKKIYDESNEDEFDKNKSLSDRAQEKIFNRLFTIANIFSSIDHYFDFTETQVISEEINNLVEFLANYKKSNTDPALNMEEFNSNNPFKRAVDISKKMIEILNKELKKTLIDIEKIIE